VYPSLTSGGGGASGSSSLEPSSVSSMMGFGPFASLSCPAIVITQYVLKVHHSSFVAL